MSHTTATQPPAGRRLLRACIALFVALAMAATACGADDAFDEATDTASSDVDRAADAAGDAVEDASGDDAEEFFVDDDMDEDDAMVEEEPMEEEEAFFDEPSSGAAPQPTVGSDSSRQLAADADDSADAVDSEDSFAASGESEKAEEDFDAEGLFAPDSATDEDEEFIDEPDPSRLQDNRFTDYGYRRFIDTDVDPLSTFALDVDTASFSVTRRWLDEGVLPPPEAVRVEEFVNSFDYDYERPRRGLEISVDGGPSPFDRDNVLVRVGVAAEEIPRGDRPPVALTFIIDTSGSMDRDDRLGLVKDSLEILVDELDDDDTVAIVVYSNDSGIVLEPTPVSERRRIYDAIDDLQPGGSTNLESGLIEGYDLAADAFRRDGVNRVIIASDGVANAGITDVADLGRFIRDYADEGIQLATIGFGMGNFNDTMMEQLADNGDGFYSYVDTIDEAERLFEDELTSTLITAAIDAKIQVEFDPDVVREYRLIGFENRGVRDSDFRNDRVDAGELGAGHQVTAMYEVELRRGIELDDRGDIGEVFLRWEDPEDGDVIEIDEDIDLRDMIEAWADTPDDFKLATIVTAFGEVMRDNPYADGVNLEQILVEADRLAGVMEDDTVDQLVVMLELANRIGGRR